MSITSLKPQRRPSRARKRRDDDDYNLELFTLSSSNQINKLLYQRIIKNNLSSLILATFTIVIINSVNCLPYSPNNNNAGSNSDRVFIVNSVISNPYHTNQHHLNNQHHSMNQNYSFSSPQQQTNGNNLQQINSFNKSDSFREIFNKLDLQVKENTPIGSNIALIPHPNLDLLDPKTIYAIIGGQDQQAFTLRVPDSSKFELINEVNFDFESDKRHYNVLIRATSLFLRYECDINIYVIDDNDNRPQLEDFTIVFNNYHQFFPNSPIGKVPASDLDINDQLRYRILSGNNAQLIVVNETNGDIQLSPWLNGNRPFKAFMTIAVSDGINEAVAHLTLIVNLVTEQMLHNSLVLKLDGINRDEFLTRKYEKFLKTMASILGSGSLSHQTSASNSQDLNTGYDASNIIILDVEDSTNNNQALSNSSSDQNNTTSNNFTNHYGNFSINRISISFSARSHDSPDVEAYLNSQYLEERIQTNRLHLTNELESNVEIGRENLCMPDTCKDYQECRAVYVFDRAPRAFLLTKNMLFRQIKSLPSYTCQCPAKLDAGALNSSSVCGPCNCDESKGFDGECDKQTGQCYCKQNHYQPLGADFCLPCDCYATGSTQTSCNQTTGQCRCRPGVVGRRCDTCTGAYAEVTPRGCEVIYDECPRTFSDGIWWNRTKLDKLATQQCPPSSSTGTATRFCHPSEGWRKANMFDCISNSFKELFTQYQFLEDNNVPLTTGLAIKIAATLRNALNETITRTQQAQAGSSGSANSLNEIDSTSQQLSAAAAAAAAARDEQNTATLYGSDIYISFRLIHRLILHESRQTGLNLTHSQDRSYVRNLVDSISYILDPAFAENWPEISARSPNGGAEYLLKLLDIYGRVLIESQSDTFTQPFEIQTKYLTFGLSTLSSEQLYEQLSHSQVHPGPSQQNKISFTINQASGSSPPYAVTDPLYGSVEHPTISQPNNEYLNTAYGNIATNHSGAATGAPATLSAVGRDPPSALVVPKHLSEPTESKATIPIETLRIKTIQDLMAGSHYQSSLAGQMASAARSRAKRDDLIIPEFRLIKQHQTPALVAYSVWRSLGPLLPSFYDNTVKYRSNLVANSPVIWLTIRAANGSDFLHKNLHSKVTYTLKMVESSRRKRPQCAVWDFNPQINGQGTFQVNSLTGGKIVNSSHHNHQKSPNAYGIKQTGKFSTRGCEIQSIQSTNPGMRSFKYEYINCSCDHLGAVVVLMDGDGSHADYLPVFSGESNNKDLILVIALMISLAILCSASFVLSCIRGHSIKSNSNSINKNIIFVLILIELLIMYNVFSKNSPTQAQYQCNMVAIFLTYFSISLFFWLLVNAIHFYRMLTELRDINHGPMRFYLVIGYAMPAFLVSIAVGLRIEQFGSDIFCWLPLNQPIIWTMFAPISFASIITIGLFLITLCKTLPVTKKTSVNEHGNNQVGINHEDESHNADLLKNHMLINIIKTPLIGLYWLVMVYVLNEALIDHTYYLLPAITIMKSMILFLLLCVIDKHIRFNLYVSWLRFRGRRIPLNGALVDYQDPYMMNQHQQQHWRNSMMTGEEYASGHLLAGGKLHDGGLYSAAVAAANVGYGLSPTTPGFQGSCTDIFRPDVLDYSQAASTTSQSSDTGGTSSSAAYHQYQQHSSRVVREASAYGRSGRSKHRRRHKKSSSHNHKHHGHSSSKHHHHHHHHRHHHHRSHRHHGGNQDGDERMNSVELINSNNFPRNSTSANHDYEYDKEYSRGRNAVQIRDSKPELASSHSSDGEESTMISAGRKGSLRNVQVADQLHRTTVPMELNPGASQEIQSTATITNNNISTSVTVTTADDENRQKEAPAEQQQLDRPTRDSQNASPEVTQQ